MSAIDVNTAEQSQMIAEWQATPELRYFSRWVENHRCTELQQRWCNMLNGETEWRNVPAVSEPTRPLKPIVERLREHWAEATPLDPSDLLYEAAEEIEKLRAASLAVEPAASE